MIDMDLTFSILKHTSSLGDLLIMPVDKDCAKRIIVSNHYSHKWNDAGFGVFNFGIFKAENTDECLGVAVYGYMKNPRAKIFSHPNPDAWVCELNRLWIDDRLGKNAETILIASSIKLLRKLDKNIVAIQSFADGRLGCGTIYKAANFKYYGYHYTLFLRNKRTGEVSHRQNFDNTTCLSIYLRSNIGYLLGDYEVMRVRTYRYVYSLDRHFSFLKREISYPEYQKGFDIIEWNRDKRRIKENIVRLLNKLPV